MEITNLNSRPLVLVIVPCYNMEQYIKRAVDSFIANDYEKSRLSS